MHETVTVHFRKHLLDACFCYWNRLEIVKRHDKTEKTKYNVLKKRTSGQSFEKASSSYLRIRYSILDLEISLER